jgi:uncharacterized protein (TIGR04255 family)
VTWTLPNAKHRIYPRNPLAVVLCQLRFQPILKIGAQVPVFQDQVRVGTKFRGYRAVEVQQVDVPVGTPGTASVVREIQHQFTADDEATLTLTHTAITLEFRKHHSRERVFADVAAAINALRDAYDPVHPIRLGLRYVNHIDRAAIGADLGRTVAWNDLIADEFFSPPVRLVDMQGTLFHTEVSSPMARGSLTLRFGLVPHQSATHFRLDSDRSVVAPFQLEEIQDLLSEFADDIFAVFDSACGSALRDWLED